LTPESAVRYPHPHQADPAKNFGRQIIDGATQGIILLGDARTQRGIDTRVIVGIVIETCSIADMGYSSPGRDWITHAAHLSVIREIPNAVLAEHFRAAGGAGVVSPRLVSAGAG
jgi:hypothetical protein